ncbi:hypothetical protein TNCV_187011 [Trichonephila clavipes]|nr:hypothetical protein TNCV_187011 [Trichonephila clavipes]
MTPEVAPLLLTSTATGGRLSYDRFNVHHPPTRRIVSGASLELITHRYESVTLTTRLPQPLDTYRALAMSLYIRLHGGSSVELDFKPVTLQRRQISSVQYSDNTVKV